LTNNLINIDNKIDMDDGDIKSDISVYQLAIKNEMPFAAWLLICQLLKEMEGNLQKRKKEKEGKRCDKRTFLCLSFTSFPFPLYILRSTPELKVIFDTYGNHQINVSNSGIMLSNMT
jgi:hypothetical protein